MINLNDMINYVQQMQSLQDASSPANSSAIKKENLKQRELCVNLIEQASWDLRTLNDTFVARISERANSISALIQQVILRLQADALACTLRRAKNSLERLSNIKEKCASDQQDNVHLTPSAIEQLCKQERTKLQRTFRKADTTMRGAKRRLQSMLASIDNGRVDTYAVRHFVENLEEVETVSVSLQPYGGSVKFDQNNIYSYDESGRAYVMTVPASLSDKQVSFTPLSLETNKKFEFVDLCSLDCLGAVGLIQMIEGNEVDKFFEEHNYSLLVEGSPVLHHLGNVSSFFVKGEAPRSVHSFSENQLLVPYKQFLRMYEVSQQANDVTFSLVQSIKTENLEFFDYNRACLLALIMQPTTAQIVSFNPLKKSNATVTDIKTASPFGAVTSHALILIQFETHDLRSIKIFDQFGRLVQCVASNPLSRPFPNFKLKTWLGTNGKKGELISLHDSIDDGKITIIRLRSSSIDVFRKRCKAGLLTRSNGALETFDRDFSEKWCNSATEKYNLEVSLASWIVKQRDFAKPEIAVALESRSAFYFLDINNNSVKRYVKVPRSNSNSRFDSATATPTYGVPESCMAYTPVFPPGCEHLIAGIGLFDEQTLAVLCNDGVIVFVHAETMHYLYSFTYRRVVSENKYLNPLLITTGVNCLFLAEEGTSAVHEIRRESVTSTNWRVAKVHCLPHKWKLKHVSFDRTCRRFLLSLTTKQDDDVVSRMSLLDQNFKEVFVLPIPAVFHRECNLQSLISSNFVVLTADKVLFFMNVQRFFNGAPLEYYGVKLNFAPHCLMSVKSEEDSYRLTAFSGYGKDEAVSSVTLNVVEDWPRYSRTRLAKAVCFQVVNTLANLLPNSISFDQLKFPTDRKQADVLFFTEDESALFILDDAYHCVKRVPKASLNNTNMFKEPIKVLILPSSASKMLRASHIKCFSILDENNLLVLRKDGLLAHVDAKTMLVRQSVLLDLPDPRLNVNAMFVSNCLRVFLFVKPNEIYVIRRTDENSTDWRVANRFKFDNSSVRHISYEATAKRFSIVWDSKKLEILNGKFVVKFSQTSWPGNEPYYSFVLSRKMCLVVSKPNADFMLLHLRHPTLLVRLCCSFPRWIEPFSARLAPDNDQQFCLTYKDEKAKQIVISKVKWHYSTGDDA